VVYPARFGRVIAACGVMADGRPYANLPPNRMAGNYGPDTKTPTAMAAYTPNVPWARFGEPTVVDFDGNGTSSATPQIAASAALWIDRHRTKYDAYREPWMGVEAVRKALFESAAQGAGHPVEFGSGLLRASEALSGEAASSVSLKATAPDSAGSGFLKLLIGDRAPGFAAAAGARPSLLELEALQVAAKAGIDPDAQRLTPAARRELIDEMLARPDLSAPLRTALEKAGVSWSAPLLVRPKAKGRTEAGNAGRAGDEASFSEAGPQSEDSHSSLPSSADLRL
jgi:hypothetical protein